MIVRPTAQALVALFALSLSSAGCASEGEGAHVVVGLTTDMAIGFDLRRVEVTLKVDGVPTSVESLSYGEGNLSLPAALPVEPTQDGAEVEASFAAFRASEASPFMTRTAATRAAGGRKLLLPVSLDEACSGATCAASETCVEGACLAPFIDPSGLGDYDPAWIASAPDACKTPSSGDPAIEIGQGESAFAALGESEIVPIEAGAQGGHHVWLALRVAGLRQMGSHLTVEGYFPELAFEVYPFTSIVNLRKAGEGQCQIYGIRLQVDWGLSVDAVRGRAFDITVTLRDPNGDAATATKQVVIAP